MKLITNFWNFIRLFRLILVPDPMWEALLHTPENRSRQDVRSLTCKGVVAVPAGNRLPNSCAWLELRHNSKHHQARDARLARILAVWGLERTRACND